MEQALIERQRVHEWLERRARRSLGHHAVHLTIDLLIPVVGRADPRAHSHVARVDKNRRGIANAPIAVLLEVSLNLALDEPLKIGIDGRVDPAGAIAAAGEKRIDEMRRSLRHRVSSSRDDRQVELTAIVIASRRSRSQASPRRMRASSNSDSDSDRPARFDGRWGITASVSASPNVKRSGGLPK